MKKRVLFLIPTLEKGGAERVLVNLVNRMDKQKYEVTVQTLVDLDKKGHQLHDSVRYIPGARHRIRGYSHLQKLLPPRTLYRMLIKEKYDVVVSFLEGMTSRIVSGCPDPDTKKVAWIHTTLDTPALAAVGFRNIREAKKCMNRFHRLICVAESVKQALPVQWELTVDVQVLYNVNQSEQIIQLSRQPLQNPAFDNDAFCVCSMGKLQAVKGYDRLIDVHKMLIDQGLTHKIYVLGSGELEQELRERIKQNGVQDSFVLLGFCENPYQYVGKCDLYVCPSRREGFSTAVSEALILGIPVVSTNCSGAHELLGEDSQYGLVVENSTKGILEGMQRMLQDPALMRHYQEMAALRGKSFDPTVTVAAVEQMLENF